MLLWPCFINIWREIHPFNFTFLLMVIFFHKTHWWYWYEIWIWWSHMYKKLLTKFKEKCFKNLYYFFRKYNLLKPRTCKFVALTQKLKIFWQNLLGTWYSPLRFLTIGMQYLKLFTILIVHDFFSKFFVKVLLFFNLKMLTYYKPLEKLCNVE